MHSLSNLILYVKNVAESTKAYKALFAVEPSIETPGFSMFTLGNGLIFGVWATAVVEPESMLTGGGGEYSFDVGSAGELDERLRAAEAAGFSIAQPISEMPFGRTFVATDIDQHRIRYILPNAN